jgi:hypothetical protein
MGFFFYPLLRRLKTLHLRSRQSDYIRSFRFSVLLSFILTFVHSFNVGKINRIGNLPHRITDVFLGSTFQHFFPLPLGDHFSIFAIPHGRQTPPLLPLSTLWHFPCQHLSVVAKVISSVFCSSFRGEDISIAVLLFISAIAFFASPAFPPFLRFLHPAVGISFQPTHKPCCRNSMSFLKCRVPNQHRS